MPTTIINNILRNMRDSSGILFSSKRLKRSKSESFRNLQTQTDLKSQQDENDAACGRSTSLWRSLNGQEGWKLFGPEKAEQVLNYYKKRWVSNGFEKATTASTLDGALETDSITAGRSLYRQWAARGLSRNGDQAKPLKPNAFVMSSNNDPFRHQTERMMSAMTKPKDGGEGRQRCLDRLKRPMSTPVFWAMDKSPLDLLANNDHDTTTRITNRQKNHSCVTRRETARPSNNDFGEEYCSEKDEDETAEEETAGKKRLHRKRTRTRPTTTEAVPKNLSPDVIPLFDVNTLKKKYGFGGRIGAGSHNS